jgi:pimeloyl-ACP methyl ester carboxylesterase
MKDLADVVSWSTERNGDRRGVVLIGHSIGALSTLLVAHRIRQLRGVVLIGCNAHAKKKFHELMAKGKVRKLARYWIIGRAKVALNFWEDRSRLEPEGFAKKITAPVLVVCGTNDVTNPPADSRTLFRWLKGPKELRLIPGTDHYFREQHPRKLISHYILRWLDLLVQ